MKRVFCLYRVSTLGQVEKDDIPMQKNACHAYVSNHPDWKITGEFTEKGISGFKKSARERDAIIEIQQAAVEKKFDVLLVFMFDRIGRRDDETLFVVEWFVKNGIEVWSVTEGEQRFETHVDKLLNYIHYWHASGESIKTSIRVKTRMGQMVKEGHFKGGIAPFGYRLEKLGRLNRKGHEVFDLVIDDTEAAIVKLIFDCHANKDMGTQNIASFLTKKNIHNRKGERFVCGTIRNMLKNPMYRGILRSGESTSKPFEHLRIIDDNAFFRSQDLTHQRSTQTAMNHATNKRYVANCLLTGIIYCENCGARLATSTAGQKRVRKDGTVYDRRYWRYICYNRMRHKEKCNGQSSYTASRIDASVVEFVRNILNQVKDLPMKHIIERHYESNIKEIETKLRIANTALVKSNNDLNSLQAELLKSIKGESVMSPNQLEMLFAKAIKKRDKVQESMKQLVEINTYLKNQKNEFMQYHNQLVAWAEVFDDCKLDVKKGIVLHIVSKVFVSSGYEIRIELSPFV